MHYKNQVVNHFLSEIEKKTSFRYVIPSTSSQLIELTNLSSRLGVLIVSGIDEPMRIRRSEITSRAQCILTFIFAGEGNVKNK